MLHYHSLYKGDGYILILALILFIITYALMLAFQNHRAYIALASALIFIILGYAGIFEMDLIRALKAVDYNVLLMITSTMGLVSMFIESKMPTRIAEMLISKVPNVKWAITVLALFAGIISAFVDNVATVLMIAPIGLIISKKLDFSPVPILIAIAVSSNLQGAATLVGDTTSILLGGFAEMNFFNFFWMQGKPGIFWGVELGALASIFVLLYIFRWRTMPINAKVETEVKDYVPSILMVGTVLSLIAVSFLPEPNNDFMKIIFNHRSGLVCFAICILGMIYEYVIRKNKNIFKNILSEIDYTTLLLLFGLFIVIEGITAAGVIDAIASLFCKLAGNSPFGLFTLIVFTSVILSAFIDNIPYVATMLPVVQSIALLMGVEPYVFYFGLLTGATLGGNLTPIGASANITAIGILKKNGYEVSIKDFVGIGVPFTIAAVLTGYVYIWLVWGI